VIVDFPMSPSPQAAASLCAIDKRKLEVTKCWEVPGARELKARMVHPEFNKGGTEIWVSAWGSKDYAHLHRGLRCPDPQGKGPDHRGLGAHAHGQVQRLQHRPRHLLRPWGPGSVPGPLTPVMETRPHPLGG